MKSMLFRKRPPALTRQQQLASRPIRLVDGEMAAADNGGGRLKVKLKQRRIGFLFRVPEGATKTFEFDQMGKFVWEHCDGKTSVQRIARKFAKNYSVSEREAQVATEKFLMMLAKKGLIGAAVPRKKEKDDP
jgi:hypothetical protein